MVYRSNEIIEKIERAPQRAYLHALGLNGSDLQKPFVAVVNTWNESSLPNAHLNALAQQIKAGVLAAGGIPFEFNTIAVSDGYTEAHEGMHYVLPSREIVADSIETLVNAHRMDGMVILASGDKPIPGAMMAIMRLNLPAVLINGGSMIPASFKGKPVSFTNVMESVAEYKSGKITEAEVHEMEEAALTSAGDGAGMYTPGTMAALAEALGLSLPFSSTTPSMRSKRLRFCRQAGELVCRLIEKGVTPRQIVTERSFENAISVGMAISGSTNLVLHLLAIANEAEIDLPLEVFNKISAQVPTLCPIDPAGPYHIPDLDEAGGIPAVMNRIRRHLHLEEQTVTGKTIGENIEGAEVYRDEVIRPLSDPFLEQGSVIMLWGNLAPGGAVAKQSAIPAGLRQHKGPAKVFDSEEKAIQAVYDGRIKAGDIIVLRFEGPKGGPGMREMLGLTSTIVGMGLKETVALVTDGRFSGASRGCCIGHICPEAADGGPIALLRDGDIVEIDVAKKTLNVLLTPEEMAVRRQSLAPFIPKFTRGYLARYSKHVGPANKGAVME